MAVRQKSKKKYNYKRIVILCAVLCIVTGCWLLIVNRMLHHTAEESPVVPATAPAEEYPTYIDEKHRKYGDLADIHIRLAIGSSVEELDIDDIAPWLSLTQKNHHYSYHIRDDEIRNYAAGLAVKYNNYQSHVSFVSHSGEEITLENRSTGWILDEEYAYSQLLHFIQEYQSVDLNLTNRSKESNQWWIRVCGNYDTQKKKGTMFAEVSIDDQYMWVMQEGKVILESPIVTGNPYTGNDTPKGAYYVYEKKSPVTLYGPGYDTEVAYWMAFVDDVGFHDATWQDYFGGDVYLSYGSHGCVNLPLSFAEQLYHTVYVNMPVYVY